MTLDVNAAAERALRTYLGMDQPGYGLMIDAPWGAGKTHFARAVCGALGAPHRYISLNGVADAAGFRAALLAESLEQDSLSKAGQAIGKIAEMAGIAGAGDIARDAIDAQLMKALPDILVFDDLERAVWASDELFGAINRFIEFDGKRVVLLVNADKHAQKDRMLERREKIVGRVLRIEADVAAAYPRFLEQMATGPGKTWLRDHETLVCGVFEDAGHHNLRVLRTAMRECAVVLDAIEESYFEAHAAMAQFVRTYLALSMALGRGEITVEDLARRSSEEIVEAVIFGDKSMDEDPLYRLHLHHKDCDIVVYEGSVMPVDLAQALFFKGFADWPEMQKAFDASGLFSSGPDEPIWKRLGQFRQADDAARHALIHEAKEYVFATDKVDVGGMLLTGFLLMSLESKVPGLTGRSDIKDVLINRIEHLRHTGQVMPSAEGQAGLSGVSSRGWSYAGHAWQVTDDMREVLVALGQAEKDVFDAMRPDIVEIMLQNFENDPVRFREMFDQERALTNYFHVVILDKLDVDRFAKILVAHLRAGRSVEMDQCIKTLAQRHDGRGKWSVEKNWVDRVRGKMRRIVGELEPVEALPVIFFFQESWQFS